MDSAARRHGGGVFEGLYRVIMRRNSVYVTFIIAGAFFGERAVDYGVRKLWEHNNVGKRYEDIPVFGAKASRRMSSSSFPKSSILYMRIMVENT